MVAPDDIHSHGVLHRNLPKRDILYNKEIRCPVIIDFGLATRKTGMSQNFEDLNLFAD